MSDLIEQARLTAEEIVFALDGVRIHPTIGGEIADAQLAKALWTFYEWSDGYWYSAEELRQTLRMCLADAGIELPPVEVKP